MTYFRNEAEKYPFFVFAKPIEQVVPDERGRRYAEPLAADLEQRDLVTNWLVNHYVTE